MSIKFACKCGKHLRAGDTMAGRHTLCPVCGALVAIPTREAAAANPLPPRPRPAPGKGPQPPPPPGPDDGEEIGPVLVRVRRRNDKDPNQYRKSIWVPLDPDRGPPPEKLPRPARSSRRRYQWKLETYWFQSIPYAFRAWPVLTGLALAQACLLVWAAVVVPKFSLGAGLQADAEPYVLAFVTFLVGVYTVGFFDCVLTSAGAGEYRHVPMPGYDLGFVGAASWFLCFLAGPVVPAGLALWYWFDCGDPDALDKIILAELAGAALTYWLLEVLAAREAGGWLAGPVAVAKVLDRLGPRSLVIAAGAPALAYVYARLATGGMARWHTDALTGIPQLAVAGFAGMYGATFLLRVVGVWSFRGRPAEPKPPEPAAAGTAPAGAAGGPDGEVCLPK